MFFYILAVILAVAADQILKFWVSAHIALGAAGPEIPGLIGLTHLHNYGAAFSQLQNMRWLFLILTPIALAVIVFVLIRRVISHPVGVWSLLAVFAGTLGNFIDRVHLGYVVDMFRLQFINFAIFNIADAFLTVGGAVFCIYFIFLYGKAEKKDAEKSGENQDA